MDRDKVIAKLEKEVKKTYSIKTIIYDNGKKVNEDITEYREPGIKISMEMADEILVLLKEQESIIKCKYCVRNGTSRCPCHYSGDPYIDWNPDDDWFCADGERR